MQPKMDQKWYVVYTRPKSEKKVACNIADMGIEAYLPVHKVVRQWSDRKKKLEVPLFPNYVFVKVDEPVRPSLYSIKDLVRFVSIENRPVVIREKEIATIKKVLEGNDDIIPEEYLQVGMKIKVKSGQLAGVEGVIAKRNNHARLVIRIDGLKRAFSLSIGAADLGQLTES